MFIKHTRVVCYFTAWFILGATSVVLNIMNIDWEKTSLFSGIVVVLILGVLQSSVMEFPLQTVATILIGGHKRECPKADSGGLTVILNYNILATCEADIDECFENAYKAFINNLAPNVSLTVVSATGDETLKRYEIKTRDTYRAVIYDLLFQEGIAFIAHKYSLVDKNRFECIWSAFKSVDTSVFIKEKLNETCSQYAREFMIIHRKSRILRKCGQYQDLMLLSDGHLTAYSYCDPEYYGRLARKRTDLMFEMSDDVMNIHQRAFDYTLVLDLDTGVPSGILRELLQIAAAFPHRGIIQPAIKLTAEPNDTLFMHIETMRQDIYEPMTNAVNALLDHSAYFGKALIKNRLYIDNIIGTPENLIERVPIDVLSHDTFEATLLNPFYASKVYLLEAPSLNYVTWNIRERRWNKGEIILALYFWPKMFGKPMRWFQSLWQRERFVKTRLRTKSHLDFVAAYVSNSALRQMALKPLLFVYIIVNCAVHMHHQIWPIVIIMGLIIIFPKLAIINRNNMHVVAIETVASILQFTPEAAVGCVRVAKALYSTISLDANWIPQRAVEEEFKSSNPFVSSIKHLWGYCLFATIVGVIVPIFEPDAIVIYFMMGTLFTLPLLTGVTSLSLNYSTKRKRNNCNSINEDV